MPNSERVALAAHLHVALRRKTGRVTDTEWMATNADYAREIVRFARARALEDGHAELAHWAGKLEAAMFGVKPTTAPASVHVVVPSAVPATPVARAPSERELSDSSRDNSGFGNSIFGNSIFGDSGYRESMPGQLDPRRDPNSPRYIGGLR
jgi:hypothetical protein